MNRATSAGVKSAVVFTLRRAICSRTDRICRRVAAARWGGSYTRKTSVMNRSKGIAVVRIVSVSCRQCGANEERDGESIDSPSQRVRGRLRRSANRQAGGPGVVARNWRDVLEGLHLLADLLPGLEPVSLPGRSLALLAAQLERRGELVEARSQLLEALTRRLHCTPPLRPLMQCATGNSSSPPATSFCGYGALDPRCSLPGE